MRLVFMEAGSGARAHVPLEMIEAVARYVSVPVIVGGGIRLASQARDIVTAGASLVVTGDVIEKTGSESLLKEFSEAIHAARAGSS